MLLPVSEQTAQRIEMLAAQNGQTVDEFLESMLSGFEQKQAGVDQFTAKVQKAVQKHAELLERLASE